MTTAATFVTNRSCRLIEPLALLCEFESVVRTRPGSTALAGLVIVLAPMKLLMPESSVVVRVTWV